jgi:hypothetical protein
MKYNVTGIRKTHFHARRQVEQQQTTNRFHTVVLTNALNGGVYRMGKPSGRMWFSMEIP